MGEPMAVPSAWREKSESKLKCGSTSSASSTTLTGLYCWDLSSLARSIFKCRVSRKNITTSNLKWLNALSQSPPLQVLQAEAWPACVSTEGHKREIKDGSNRSTRTQIHFFSFHQTFLVLRFTFSWNCCVGWTLNLSQKVWLQGCQRRSATKFTSPISTTPLPIPAFFIMMIGSDFDLRTRSPDGWFFWLSARDLSEANKPAHVKTIWSLSYSVLVCAASSTLVDVHWHIPKPAGRFHSHTLVSANDKYWLSLKIHFWVLSLNKECTNTWRYRANPSQTAPHLSGRWDVDGARTRL